MVGTMSSPIGFCTCVCSAMDMLSSLLSITGPKKLLKLITLILVRPIGVYFRYIYRRFFLIQRLKTLLTLPLTLLSGPMFQEDWIIKSSTIYSHLLLTQDYLKLDKLSSICVRNITFGKKFVAFSEFCSYYTFPSFWSAMKSHYNLLKRLGNSDE